MKNDLREEAVTLTCNFLFCCAGYYRYSAGYLPEFPNSSRFKGRMFHPQAWPQDLDYAGKRVVDHRQRRNSGDAGSCHG